MRIVLLGSTEITQRVAETLLHGDLGLAGVVHLPRDFRVSYAPTGVRNVRHVDLEKWTRDAGLPAIAYHSETDVRSFAEDLGADFCLVCGWYHLVTAPTRGAFAHGCAGLHASLLPHLRGGAPLNWALLNGDNEAGVTLFELSDGVDDGPILSQRRFSIGSRDYIGDLVRKSIDAACDIVAATIPLVANGSVERRPQAGTPTFGLQRNPDDGLIDWARDAATIDRLVRAVSEPYPGAWSSLEGRRVIVWRARPAAPEEPAVFGAPGQICTFLGGKSEIGVVTGDGVLIVERATYEDGVDALSELRARNQRRFSPAARASEANLAANPE